MISGLFQVATFLLVGFTSIMRFSTTALTSLFGLAIAQAGLSPQNVAVVVNGDSWASLTIANEYSRLRQIPQSNVIVLKNLSGFDLTDADHFRSEILNPVFAELKSRGILSQIDCITYSADIPYSVSVNGDMVGKQFPQVITPTASTNGLTFLHQLVEAKDTDYLSLNISRYNRRLLPLPVGTRLNVAEQAEYAKGIGLYDAKKYPEAIAILSKLVTVKRSDANIYYNLACCYSLAKQYDEALLTLRAAVGAGWRNFGQTSSDPDLAPLAEKEEFQRILRMLKAAQIEVQPGVGFESRLSWDESGAPGATGPQYMLSTMLGVTSGRGNSVREVLDCLARAKTADFTVPKGSIYFPKNGDVRSTTREWGFAPAVNALKLLGVNAAVEDGILPKDHADVAGAMIGIADFDWSKSGSKILPGAIVEHLTSFGGIISERAGQSPCTDFIRAGATGSSGTVTEPFALQEKFPSPFMHVQYAKGFTLAESFYQSLYGPYQLLVIGDPMCRPWAKPLKITSNIAPGSVLKGTVSISPAADRKGDVARYEVTLDGKPVTDSKALTINTSNIADGNHVLGIVALEKSDTQAKTQILIPIVVNNHARKLTAATATASVEFGGRFKVDASCPGASALELMHLGRGVGKISAAKGAIEINTTQIGIGTITLQPVATIGTERVFGTPIMVKVSAPTAIAPTGAEGATVPGLCLTMPGKPSVKVLDTIDPNFLSKLTSGGNQEFTLTGYYTAPEDDLYQLQIRSNAKVRVDVNGKEILVAPP
ncbi:MAG: tetratricopeptide repeat protein [Armatimonadetes bacterium]|nr:tetratricopeptide repeat protein [Armatimonadota bacterium]